MRFWILLAAACALRVGAADTGDAALRRAIQLHQQGQVDAAIPAYQEYLKSHPRSLPARSNLGAVLARLGRYEEAMTQYQQALEIDPAQAGVRLNLALAYYKQARLEDAVRELGTVRAQQPGHTQATLLLADAHLRLGENDAVIKLLEPWKSSDPAVAYLLGSAYLRSGLVTEGQRVIDPILRAGETPEVLLLLGEAQLASGDHKAAMASLAKAVERNPKLPGAHALLGRARLQDGDQANAMEAFRRELALEPHDFDANLHLGALLRLEKLIDEAAPHLEAALRIRPQSLAARYQVGALRLAQGRTEEARIELEQVTQADAKFLEPHVALATVYYRLKRKTDGDRERAIVEKLNAENQEKELKKP